MTKEATTLKKLIKKNQRGPASAFYVNKVDGTPWYTNTFFAAQADKALADLLGAHNLDYTEPGAFHLNGKVTSVDATPPDIANIVTGAKFDNDLTPATYADKPIVVCTGSAKAGGEAVPLEGVSEGPVFVARDMFDYLTTMHPGATFKGTTDLKPVGVFVAGELVAIIMPVRIDGPARY